MVIIQNSKGVILPGYKGKGSSQALIPIGKKYIQLAVRKPLKDLSMVRQWGRRVLDGLRITPYVQFKIRSAETGEAVETVEISLTDLKKANLISISFFARPKGEGDKIQTHVQGEITWRHSLWNNGNDGPEMKKLKVRKKVMEDRQLGLEALSLAAKSDRRVTSSGTFTVEVVQEGFGPLYLAGRQCRSFEDIKQDTEVKESFMEMVKSEHQVFKDIPGYSSARGILEGKKELIQDMVDEKLQKSSFEGDLLLEYDTHVKINYSTGDFRMDGDSKPSVPQQVKDLKVTPIRQVRVKCPDNIKMKATDIGGPTGLRAQIDQQMRELLMAGIAVSDESVTCELSRNDKEELVATILQEDKGVIEGCKVDLVLVKTGEEEIPALLYVGGEGVKPEKAGSVEDELNKRIKRLYGTEQAERAATVLKEHEEKINLQVQAYRAMAVFRGESDLGGRVHVELKGQLGSQQPLVTRDPGAVLNVDIKAEYEKLTPEKKSEKSFEKFALFELSVKITLGGLVQNYYEELLEDSDLTSVYKQEGRRLPQVSHDDLRELENALNDLKKAADEAGEGPEWRLQYNQLKMLRNRVTNVGGGG